MKKKCTHSFITYKPKYVDPTTAIHTLTLKAMYPIKSDIKLQTMYIMMISFDIKFTRSLTIYRK